MIQLTCDQTSPSNFQIVMQWGREGKADRRTTNTKEIEAKTTATFELPFPHEMAKYLEPETHPSHFQENTQSCPNGEINFVSLLQKVDTDIFLLWEVPLHVTTLCGIPVRPYIPRGPNTTLGGRSGVNVDITDDVILKKMSVPDKVETLRSELPRGAPTGTSNRVRRWLRTVAWCFTSAKTPGVPGVPDTAAVALRKSVRLGYGR